MKKVFIIFWGLAGLVVLLVLGSFAYESYLGRDEKRIKVKNGEYSFSADRDSVGVWKVKSSRVEDLWFAYGYLHMFDREFQMEMLRNASLGKLASIVGERAIEHDRLMRMASRTAQVEWNDLDNSSLRKRAARAYVDGVQAFRSSADKAEPFEFKVLGMSRQSNEAWSPWEILAISKYQAWQFSFDLEHEVFVERLRNLIGPAQFKMADLFPRVGVEADSYSSPHLRDSVKSWPQTNLNLQDFWIPREDLGPIEGRIPKQLSAQLPSASGALLAEFGDFGTEKWATLGASNVWIASRLKSKDAVQKTQDPILCNDTHLRLSWPTPLYPMQFDLDGSLIGTGFSIPGVPALILGSIEKVGERRMAWGITLGNYADTQDLVVDRAKKAKILGKIKERYLVRNSKTGALEERVIEEKLSDLGWDVSEAFAAEVFPEDLALSENRPSIYLDWHGYRKFKNPFEFYLNRNLFLDENLDSDMQNNWDYPSVNFNYMKSASKGPVVVGHYFTGLQYGRDRSNLDDLMLDSTQLSKRKLYRLGASKYFQKTLGEDEFLLVSANQKPFAGEAVDRVAYSWEPESRAKRILALTEGIFDNPESPQSDYYAISLVDFYRRARAKVTNNSICQVGRFDEREFCLGLWFRLEKWSGVLDANSWEASVLSLWMSLAKQLLLPDNFPYQKSFADKIFREYTQKGASDEALLNLMSTDQRIAEWEKSRKRKFNKQLGELFSKAVGLLSQERGFDTRLWAWSSLHKIDWYYAIGEAPPPYGEIFEESLLGPRIPVGGGFDNPGSMEFQWSPQAPTEFPAVHGAAMRACYEFKADGATKVRWAVPNGPSGNSFSKWSRVFAKRSYFKNKLVDAR